MSTLRVLACKLTQYPWRYLSNAKRVEKIHRPRELAITAWVATRPKKAHHATRGSSSDRWWPFGICRISWPRARNIGECDMECDRLEQAAEEVSIAGSAPRAASAARFPGATHGLFMLRCIGVRRFKRSARPDPVSVPVQGRVHTHGATSTSFGRSLGADEAVNLLHRRLHVAHKTRSDACPSSPLTCPTLSPKAPPTRARLAQKQTLPHCGRDAHLLHTFHLWQYTRFHLWYSKELSVGNRTS